jgi:hypothetical protein
VLGAFSGARPADAWLRAFRQPMLAARPSLIRVQALAVLVLLHAGAAPPARAQLGSIETEQMRLVFFEGSESFLVPHAARTFLNALRFQETLFDYEPAEKITVLLADFSDYGNAGASSVPRNALQVQIAPLSFAFETIAANERMNTIMNHELVHVATMDQAAGSDRLFRSLFRGKVNPVAEQPETVLYFYLTSPRVAAPRWYHEGIAVFIDTWMAGGLGRAQGGYDEMVFRSMVRDGARFYDPLGLVSEGTKIDFQLQINSYLYGTRFMTWLAHRYSPEKLIEWVSRRPGTRAYYAAQFARVFGTSLERAWNDWIAFEHEFQRMNLAAIEQYPVTPFRDLSPRALGSVSRAYYDRTSRTLYAALNYPGVVAHVGAIDTDTGAVDRLVDIKGPVVYQVSSLAYDPAGPTLFYTTDNGAYRDLMALDPRTKKTRVLLKDARIGDLAFDRADRALWGVRHLNGICTLVRIVAPYDDWTRVVSLPYGTVVYDIDVSPDGTMLSGSFGEVSGQQNVRVLRTADLLAGRLEPVTEFDFGPSVPSGFSFSPDGRYLYGSAYYTGASNIFRYDLSARTLDAVTNSETGFFRPIPLGNHELIAFRYTGAGFVPTRLTATPLQDVSAITFLGERVVEAHPVLKQWVIGSPLQIPYDTMPKQSGTYRLGGGLQLESFYPIVQGYKDTAAVGGRLNVSDPLQLNRASLSGSVSPAGDLRDSERIHLRAEYHRYDWYAHMALNDADFYDLFGPTKSSRKGYSLGLGRKTTLVFDEPRRMQLDIEGRVAGNLDQLPQYQNVAVAVDRLVSMHATLDEQNTRSSLGNVDDEKGRRWSVTYSGDYVNAQAFSRLQATFDRGWALPIGHSSVWVRTAAGLSPQDPDEPFANFYFGGFGNNYVDHGDEKRYRHYFSFPGLELNELGGRNFVKAVAEWNLPPVRFSRAGTAGAYLAWARPAVFVAGLATNLDMPARRRRAVSAGAQVDFRFTILSTLDFTLSAGGAIASADGRRPGREAMVSLKVFR